MGVDELLAVAEIMEVNRRSEPRLEMDTGSYDIPFFDAKTAKADDGNLSVTLADPLENAASGLTVFLEEAQVALETMDMSVDQRFHIATIVSYIEALGKRFDTVRQPDWHRNRKQRGLRALAALMMGTLT